MNVLLISWRKEKEAEANDERQELREELGVKVTFMNI